MINQIKTDIIVSGNGHYDTITGWFWSETKSKMFYCHEDISDKDIGYDNWSKVHECVMSPICVAVKVPELNRSYFSYILKDLKS